MATAESCTHYGLERIQVTKLVNFNGDRAEYHRDGVAFDAVKVGRHWYLTGDYTCLTDAPGPVDVTHIKEYGLDTPLSFSIRCF